MRFIPISEDPPYGEDVILWLRAEDGAETPLGAVIARYQNTPMGEMWCQRVLGPEQINGGIRNNLITHYARIEAP